MSRDESPKISVAMATYNGANYLQEQLDSFLHQAKHPDELVICDDNSTDDTVRILENFKRKASFEVLIYINKENLGYIRNFEKAMDLATGDLIFLSDQDDVWFPEKIQEVTNLFNEKPNVWLVINNQEFADENLVPSGILNLERLKLFGLSEFQMRSGCCTAFRKELKAHILPIPSTMKGHDLWIHRLAEALERKYVYSNVLQYYRRHGSNSSEAFMKRPGEVGKLEYFFKNLFTVDVGYHEQELKILMGLRTRLQNHDLLSTQKKLEIDGKIRSEEARVDLLNSNFFDRKRKAIQILKNGHYKNFSGYKSFLKDLIL